MNWLTGVSILPRLQLLGWAAAIVLAACLVGGAAGYRLGTARGDARVATLQAEYKQAQIEAVAAAETDRKREQARADQLAAELARTQSELQTAHVNQSRKVPYVTTVYVPATAAQPVPLPRTVFTLGFARLWDDANGIDLPEASTPACRVDREARPGEAIDEACLYDSGITQAELLNNHIDNAARCRAIEATLDQYIEWHRGLLP